MSLQESTETGSVKATSQDTEGVSKNVLDAAFEFAAFATFILGEARKAEILDLGDMLLKKMRLIATVRGLSKSEIKQYEERALEMINEVNPEDVSFVETGDNGTETEKPTIH